MKNLLVSILCLFYFNTSKAQIGLCFDCYGSVETGMVYSNIGGLDNTEGKPGFYIGWYNYYWLSESLSLRYGSTYQTLGAQTDNMQNDFVIHSFNFPLSLHYIYDNIFQIFGGAEVGTNIFGSLSEDEGFINNHNFSDAITLLDGSIFLGGGLLIADRIDINFKYNFGITDIRTDQFKNTNESTNPWTKNWLTLGIAYTWRD
jgi:hypothetical protein